MTTLTNTPHGPANAPEPLAIVGPWQWDNDEYETQYAETTDPRVLAVIQRDDNAQAPDGDAFAPAFWVEYRDAYRTNRAGFTFQDEASEDIAARYCDALDRFAYRITHYASERTPGFMLPRWEYVGGSRDVQSIAARWLRIFHGAQIAEVDLRGASYGTDGRLFIFDTPTYRDAMGTPPLGQDADLDARYLEGDREEWTAYMSGEVYGVGYATMTARTTAETPVELGGVTDNGDTWDIEMQCWGFAGEAYARETAGTFEHGAPSLPTMLPGTAPTVAGVTL